jgi:dihydroneopterin aldolase
LKIIIEKLKIEAIIGILDFERITPQSVLVDIEATYDYLKTSKFIDYSQITQIITTDIQESKYELIEEALVSLKDILTLEFPTISSLYVKISKPNILSNCTVGVSELWNF